ncbi:hypothetical protein N7463_000490 [Penicillium fimorum]|uniref:Uncharacterized protein n=1 Tax=Penicillium fimorum TaxID=1882269 RepID=A0A9W9Y4E4_9EURO|nr:hypothetical protein N7463_000490 [Penicillium fimorum]
MGVINNCILVFSEDRGQFADAWSITTTHLRPATIHVQPFQWELFRRTERQYLLPHYVSEMDRLGRQHECTKVGCNGNLQQFPES